MTDYTEVLTSLNHDYGKDFIEFRDQIPDSHWGKEDLLSVRLGWEAHKLLNSGGVELSETALFWTPKSQEELLDKIEQLSGREERSIATQYAMFAWNLACHLTNNGPEDTAHKEKTLDDN